MNYKKTQGSFYCTDVPVLDFDSCVRSIAAEDDIKNGNIRFYVFFTDGKLSTDNVQRFFFGNIISVPDIVIFSNGVSKDAEKLLDNYRRYYPSLNPIFKPFRRAL